MDIKFFKRVWAEISKLKNIEIITANFDIYKVTFRKKNTS